MKRASPLGTADRRPRIHIWPNGTGSAWSFGPCGVRTHAPTPGDALNAALARINGAEAVIFHERSDHVRSLEG